MKGAEMSPPAGHDRLSRLKDRYDIIVIGGGIQGATMAWEAASRGLSILLLEQNDFGSGVSANSLKIIHGGIRYLQRLDIARMRQSIRERRTLLRIAPHLVRPMRCVIPAYANFGKGRFALGVGTKLYDFIAIDSNSGLDPTRRIMGSRILSANEFKNLFPNLVHTDISGGASWWDAQVHNSERLVLAFVMSAKAMGAGVCNYIRSVEFILDNGRVKGVMAEDLISGDKREIQGDVIMDCTGPWINNTSTESGRHFAMGMNLVIQCRLSDYALGIKPHRTSKGMLFFTPWREGGIIGTWYEHAFDTGAPIDLRIAQEDIKASLAEFNSVFTETVVKLEDVTAVHLGLLPVLTDLCDSEEPLLNDRFSIVDEIKNNAAGLFRIQGVKYTTARDVSSRALNAAMPYLASMPGHPASRVMPLYGGDIGFVDEFYNTCFCQYTPRFSYDTVKRLIENYGSQIHSIMAYANSSPELARRVPGTENILLAELEFVVNHEMVWKLSDLLFRRTDLGSFSKPSGQTIYFCADWMAKKMGWDAGMRNKNIRDLQLQLPRWMP